MKSAILSVLSLAFLASCHTVMPLNLASTSDTSSISGSTASLYAFATGKGGNVAIESINGKRVSVSTFRAILVDPGMKTVEVISLEKGPVNPQHLVMHVTGRSATFNFNAKSGRSYKFSSDAQNMTLTDVTKGSPHVVEVKKLITRNP
ncbi:MAG: hypothetical protein ACSHYF_02975 [Verrucomicrobiaceae bacterium]